ncbi:SRPBCC family protein [Caldibacillus lycopersici]|uniref:SRPBCC family protein n=1 Tax=Perspicuibacillus lycopersici TaxID=1325689 RepID=A0AAE3LP88_9BACI|nr:SRPBCC family protein [Perspicuibacillus lycopersici]MCU9614741.1 SRPBCC family protein [Perspicuibacillus lycopersici]
MNGVILKTSKGYTATFERQFQAPIEEVWSWLTVNEKLSQWFSELHIDQLRDGGLITFDMGNGAFEEMVITDYQKQEVLEFTWADDLVRFELTEEAYGCKLIFIEKIKTITEHTAKDLAGWHVCLDVIEALISEKMFDRNSAWEKWYIEYTNALKNCG